MPSVLLGNRPPGRGRGATGACEAVSARRHCACAREGGRTRQTSAGRGGAEAGGQKAQPGPGVSAGNTEISARCSNPACTVKKVNGEYAIKVFYACTIRFDTKIIP